MTKKMIRLNSTEILTIEMVIDLLSMNDFYEHSKAHRRILQGILDKSNGVKKEERE